MTLNWGEFDKFQTSLCISDRASFNLSHFIIVLTNWGATTISDFCFKCAIIVILLLMYSFVFKCYIRTHVPYRAGRLARNVFKCHLPDHAQMCTHLEGSNEGSYIRFVQVLLTFKKKTIFKPAPIYGFCQILYSTHTLVLRTWRWTPTYMTPINTFLLGLVELQDFFLSTLGQDIKIQARVQDGKTNFVYSFHSAQLDTFLKKHYKSWLQQI